MNASKVEDYVEHVEHKAPFHLREIIDLDAVPSKKARAQSIVCLCSTIVCALMSLALLALSVFLPIWVGVSGKHITYICMGGEAVAFGCMVAARWIDKNALAKE